MTGALAALQRSRRSAPVRPWLFSIAYNESMTLLRRRRPGTELPIELPAQGGSPEEAADLRARMGQLMDDLRRLPDRQRGALVMRELSGLSHEEVAQALGISVGAAKQAVFEARRSLQEFAEGRSMVCESVRHLISDGDGRSLRGRRVRAHLRSCPGCAAFSIAIGERRAELRALAPALPAAAATGLLVRITGVGSAQGSGGSAGLAAGATSKALVAGVSGKLLAAGAVIAATAALGAGGALHALTSQAGSATAAPSAPGTARAGSFAAASGARASDSRGSRSAAAARHRTRAGNSGSSRVTGTGGTRSHHNHAGARGSGASHASSATHAHQADRLAAGRKAAAKTSRPARHQHVKSASAGGKTAGSATSSAKAIHKRHLVSPSSSHSASPASPAAGVLSKALKPSISAQPSAVS
jgi:RNA polymerase sigma factor (sigma-70 family)